MIVHSVRIGLSGRHARVCLGFQSLRAGVVHGSAERQERADNEQKISDVTTGHSFLPVCHMNSQIASNHPYKLTGMMVERHPSRDQFSNGGTSRPFTGTRLAARSELVR